MKRAVVTSSRAAGRSRQRGLSLVELMVAALLGVLLGAAVVTLFLGGKRHYLYTQQSARIQENGRYALRLLTRELAMAGFYGGLARVDGLSAAAVGTDCAPSNWALEPSLPVDSVDDFPGGTPRSAGAVAFDCIDGSAVRPGTDLLALKRTFGQASMRDGVVAARLTASTGPVWYLQTRDGAHPRWEQLAPRDLLSPALADPAHSYWEASARVYFIRRYASRPGDGLPALCMETLAGDAMSARCLVEGVEDMQVEFGLDSDGDGVANRYRPLASAADSGRAVSARIYLLLRSIAPLPGHSDRKAYRLGRRTVSATGDPYLRRVFSATVRLRNRGGPLA